MIDEWELGHVAAFLLALREEFAYNPLGRHNGQSRTDLSGGS